MEDFIIIMSELVALVAVTVFSGILESRYYQYLKIRYLFCGIVCAVLLWAIILFFDAPLEEDLVLQFVGAHVGFNLAMVGLYLYAYYEFRKLKFEYDFQYLMSQWILGIGAVSAVIAVGASAWTLISSSVKALVL